MINTNKYIKNVEQKIVNIVKTSDELQIVNAGFMNGGKSSLFNAILGKNVFKVKDVRCTTTSQKEKLYENIYLVDTPGLAADKEDDKQAFEVYKEADLILFVHGLKAAAEIRKEEILKIKNMIDVFATEESFWKRFYLILSYSDEYENDEDRKMIEKNIVSIFQKYFGINNFPIFFISNLSYEFWLNDNDANELEKSGIKTLKGALQESIERIQQDKKTLIYQRIIAVLKKAKKELSKEKNEAEGLLKIKEESTDKQKRNSQEFINLYFDSIINTKGVLSRNQDELKKLERELNAL